jgi:WhiB family redox-sensing transcriptional regulator
MCTHHDGRVQPVIQISSPNKNKKIIAKTLEIALRPAYRDTVLLAYSTKSQVINLSILATSLALGSADYSWRNEALCRDTDPELFFPIGTTGQALLQISEAKNVCCECTVKRECLEFAIETNQDCGIWGGLSEDERRDVRRKMAAERRAARATA